LLLVGGFSAGCSDLRLLSGDASSVCNFNIGFAARLVVVCYLLCPVEFVIRQRHYSASLQLAFVALRQNVMCDFFQRWELQIPDFFLSRIANSAERWSISRKRPVTGVCNFNLLLFCWGCRSPFLFCRICNSAAAL
jgi:hypothetical protein